MFGQTFDLHDLVIVGLLIVLEGVLSIDNALVLGLLARRLPKKLQGRALTYGLVGAFAFRVVAILLAAYLLSWHIVKLIGGGYLIYVSVKHFFFESRAEHPHEIAVAEDESPVLVDPDSKQPLDPEATRAHIASRAATTGIAIDYLNPYRKVAKFWPTVAVIELTDIAFAIDSILAAIALVGAPPADHPHHAPHPKLWVVITGGMLGVVLMRFAAVVFIRLLEKFPRFETAAYLLVALIGLKLGVDWMFNSKAQPHMVDFHDYTSAPFWAFWISMLLCFCVGFIPQRHRPSPASTTAAV